MTFAWPGISDVLYRLWRLRRLIAFGALLPVLAFGALGALGFGPAATVAGFGAVSGILLVLVALHAVLFPNSNHETLAVSLALAFLGIAIPLISGSFFGWFLFGIFTIWVICSGQNRILVWASTRKSHQPTFASRIRVAAPIDKARAWFPLRPESTRGHYRSGKADAAGVFPVWYDMPGADIFETLDIEKPADLAHLDDPAFDPYDIDQRSDPPSFHAVIEAEDDTFQTTRILEGADPDAAVQAIVEHRFKATKSGCVVTEREAATDYPWGQSFTLWLADFAQDGLVYHRDLLEQRDTQSFRDAHRWSLVMLASKWFLKRMMRRGGGTMACAAGTSGAEISDEKLEALLNRLGPEYMAKGHGSGPMPLVTLEEFFDGNGDDASFQGAAIETARLALEGLRRRPEVADVRLGITQWDGPSTWPLAEYVYVVTTAKAAEVRQMLKEAGVWVDELAEGEEHRPREDLTVPEGHRVVWAWID